MNTRLGICIPTYKRPEQLYSCVQSIIVAAAPFEVPIFIVDDSADTSNQSVLQKLCDEYPHIFITTNKKNLGIDGNILNSVNICTCEYAWMLGEDDRLESNGVQTILPLLDKHSGDEWPFFFVNYASVDADIKLYLKEKALNITKDIIEKADVFLTQHSWAAGFIGGCIINKKLWNTIDQKQYIGTYFAHVGTIMEMLHDSQVYLVASPLVLNRCGEPRLFTWSDSTFNVAGGWKEMMTMLEAKYTPQLCQQAVKQFETVHGLYTFRFLCYARADYAYRLKHYYEFLKPLYPGFIYRSIAKLIACTPPQIFKVIRFVITRYRRIANPAVTTF